MHHFAAYIHFITDDKRGFGVITVIFQPVLPLAAFILALCNRRIERAITPGHAPVHLLDILRRYIQTIRNLLDLLWGELPPINRINLAFDLSQVEEQFLLCRRCANFYQRPAPQNIFLYGGAYPPHRIGRQPETTLGIELFDRLH